MQIIHPKSHRKNNTFLQIIQDKRNKKIMLQIQKLDQEAQSLVYTDKEYWDNRKACWSLIDQLKEVR